MSLPSPEELRRKKQAVPTARLVRWAEDAGFEVRRSAGGTSHIICRHSQYKDIQFNIIADSKKLSSTMNLSDALKELERRKSSPVLLAQNFEDASKERFATLKENLPSYLIAEQDFKNGVTVIRDRQLPQIGFTLKQGDENALERGIRHHEDLKREVFILLNRYDIKISFEHGASIGKLLHPTYDLPVHKIEPYAAGESPTKLFDEMQVFINKVEEIDIDHELRLDDVLKHDFVNIAMITYQARRGERTNVLSLEKPNGTRFSIAFETASNRRNKLWDENGKRLPLNVHEGRITESELSRLEKTIHTLAVAHSGKNNAMPAARYA